MRREQMESPRPARDSATREAHQPAGPDPFLRRVFTAVGIGVLALLLLGMLVLGAEILLAAFAGILGAVFLLMLRDFVTRYTGIPEGWSLALVVVLLTALVALGGWLLAPQFAEQFDQLMEEMPRRLQEVEQFLQQYGWGREVLDAVEGGAEDGAMMEWTQFTLASLSGLFSFLLVVVFVALFVAANPGMYRKGILRLVPLRKRARAEEIMDQLGSTMRWWLMGQVLAMILIGASVGILLAVLGIPFAIALGVIVGLLAFIPYLGPLLGAIPIALIALMQGPTMLLYTMLGYIAVQTVESYVITPMIQHRMVYLPPALTIVFQMLFGALLGIIGFVLATPLVALLMVFIKLTYVEGTLGDRQSEEE
ncbi:AI-2E family transporter [soil metagenome]